VRTDPTQHPCRQDERFTLRIFSLCAYMLTTKSESVKSTNQGWNHDAVNGYFKTKFKPETIRYLYLLIRVVYESTDDPILQTETLVVGNESVFLFEDRIRKKNSVHLLLLYILFANLLGNY
jgi:hypothetical protein